MTWDGRLWLGLLLKIWDRRLWLELLRHEIEGDDRDYMVTLDKKLHDQDYMLTWYTKLWSVLVVDIRQLTVFIF